MPDHIPFIRIFISSPGDVNDERKIALEVIEQLPYRPTFREKVAFRVIAWDKPGAGTPMRATLTPQAAINKGLPTPAECDIVVVLFWSRMGTPLIHEGKSYLSGTHWELLNALEATRPETVIYRRTDDPPFKISDPDFDKLHEQYKMVKAFLASDVFYAADGTIKRGINMYKTPDDFRRDFEIALEVLVLDILKRADSHPPEPDRRDDDNISTIRAVTWDAAKSPFLGLRAFTEADAPIFFGRGQETSELVKRVEASRFTAVVAASGSGKSSLVAAGLIPRLKANAIVSGETGSKDWRFVRLTPGQGESPFAALFTALCEAFPEHPVSPFLIEQEMDGFVTSIIKNPAALVSICDALLREAKAPAWAEILFFVDQFEELFTLVPDADRAPFVALLEAIHTSRRLRCIVTMRSDFYANCLDLPALAALLKEATYPLAVPTAGALVEMIKRPAERAGLMWDDGLPERIQSDTGSDTGALALMAYALDELYHTSLADQRLTFAAYKAIGGVEGAIGKRAETAFEKLTLPDKDRLLQRVFRDLVTVNPQTGAATRLRAPLNHFDADERGLVRAFADARLLVTQDDAVEVAHEAVFRSWTWLKNWIAEAQEDLILLRQVRAAAAEWVRHAKDDSFRLPAERLKPVYEMIERQQPTLSDTERDFIEPEQARLLRELDKRETTHERRRDIGDRLAVIGDTRFGVGVKDGVPEIAWLLVTPGGKVTIEKKKFTIQPFYVAQYQVTYAQFQTFLDAHDGFENARWWEDAYEKQEMGQQRIKITNAPRDSVSWYQSVAFARWLDAKYRELGVFAHFPVKTPIWVSHEGERAVARPYETITLSPSQWQVRLPTEWEWQWMAQGGTKVKTYPWGHWEIGYANTSEAGLSRTTAVGMYLQGAADCGALDVAGNLQEWCRIVSLYDEKRDYGILALEKLDTTVLRGGSYRLHSTYAETSFRSRFNPYTYDGDYGLRLVTAAPITDF